MKERPIIFSAPMVREILEGRKKQTRRVVKPQPTDAGLEWVTACGGDFSAWQDPGLNLDEHSEDGGPCQRVCPHGLLGDRLWVREAARCFMRGSNGLSGALQKPTMQVQYAAGGSEVFDSFGDWFPRIDFLKGSSKPRWQHSIHMPRWASRITLEITGVRVERLHDISEADAIAEGVERTVTGDGWRRYTTDKEQEACGMTPCATAVNSYRSLWESINGPGSWDANPWVWVVEFKRV